MSRHHGRPNIPEALKPIELRKKITLELARYKSIEEVHKQFAPAVDFEEFDHYFNLDTQQDMIEQTRHALAEKLPIYSEDWCLIKLNEIAVRSDATAAEVLSAIRTRNALMRDGGLSDQDFIDEVSGDMRGDPMEGTGDAEPTPD